MGCGGGGGGGVKVNPVNKLMIVRLRQLFSEYLVEQASNNSNKCDIFIYICYRLLEDY